MINLYIKKNFNLILIFDMKYAASGKAILNRAEQPGAHIQNSIPSIRRKLKCPPHNII